MHAAPSSHHLVSIDRHGGVCTWDITHDIALQRSSSLPFVPGYAATFVKRGVDQGVDHLVLSVASMPMDGIAGVYDIKCFMGGL